MSEFPLDLYPPADFTREDILRQIFGEVGDLCHGKIRTDIIFREDFSFFELLKQKSIIVCL